MILIDKLGLLHVKDDLTSEQYLIEDKEVLSFLRNTVSGIHKDYTVRDFIKMFQNYPSLLMIIPEFEEVIEASEKYKKFTHVDLDSLYMNIGADIVARQDEEYSSMFFNFNGVTKLQENFSLNVPAYSLALKNVINSKIQIMDTLVLSFELGDEQSFKGHLPFAVQNFTLFDIISVVSSNLIKNTENEGSDDVFEDIKQKLFTLKGMIAEKLGVDPQLLEDTVEVDKETVDENTNNVVNQIQNLLNPDKK